jgi:hypothetical protein
MAIKLTDAEIERTQVEQVFGLTGGELSDESWGGYAWNYDSVPEWACDDFPRDVRYGAGGNYRTVIVTGGGFLPTPKAVIEVDGQAWDLVKTYGNSGETACCFEDGSGVKVTREHCRLVRTFPKNRKSLGYNPKDMTAYRAECPYCEARIGEKHGYIYVGESYEAVYQKRAPLYEIKAPVNGKWEKAGEVRMDPDDLTDWDIVQAIGKVLGKDLRLNGMEILTSETGLDLFSQEGPQVYSLVKVKED